MSRIEVTLDSLRARGIEVLPRGGKTLSLPKHTVIEAPASLKWTTYEHMIELGAFSYQVSGYCFGARIGRYCSFGEDVQIGRQDHPTGWASTSPAFYLGDAVFGLPPASHAGGKDWAGTRFEFRNGPPTRAQLTTIGNDVWIGHGAYIRAGITIGDGAIVAAHSVVTRDVPPYAIVAGNPATVRRHRLNKRLAHDMIKRQWWRFAPWQIAHLDPSRPRDFINGIAEMENEPPYTPEVLDLREAK